MKTRTWYDSAVGGYYISYRTIPESVKARGGLIELVSKDDAINAIKEAFTEGSLEGYHGSNSESVRVAIDAFIDWLLEDDE